MAIAIDIPKLDPLPSYYTVQRGQSGTYMGSPLTQTAHSYDNSAEVTHTLIADLNYLQIDTDAEATGPLEAWSVYQANGNSADYPIPIGDVKCVILRDVTSNFIIQAIGEMTHSISQQGVIEFPFPAGTIIGRADCFIGLWIKAGSKFKLGYMPDTTGQGISNGGTFLVPDVEEPIFGTGTGVGYNLAPNGRGFRESLSGKMYCMAARGPLSSVTDVTRFWISDGSGEDAYGWSNFVLNTNAFADANMVNAANLFDTTTSTSTIAVNTTGNMYYNLDAIAGLVPAARFAMRINPALGTGGRVTIYTCENTTVAKTLVGAQAIPAGEWVEVTTFQGAIATPASTSYEYHIGRKAKWVRIEGVAGTTDGIAIEHFEVRIGNIEVTDGHALPRAPGLKDRIIIDENGHQEARFYTSRLSQFYPNPESVCHIETANAAFYDQLPIGGYIVCRDPGPLGKPRGARRIPISGKNVAAQTLSFPDGIGMGKSFLQGAFIEPAPWWYQVTAWNASGQVIAVSNWLGNNSCVAPGFRSGAPFSTTGK